MNNFISFMWGGGDSVELHKIHIKDRCIICDGQSCLENSPVSGVKEQQRGGSFRVMQPGPLLNKGSGTSLISLCL